MSEAGVMAFLVPVELHVPLKALVTLVAGVEFRVDVTALNVSDERRFTAKPRVAYVAEKLGLGDRILDHFSTEVIQKLALVSLKRTTKTNQS